MTHWTFKVQLQHAFVTRFPYFLLTVLVKRLMRSVACRMTTTGSPEHYLENDGKPLAELSGERREALSRTIWSNRGRCAVVISGQL